LEASSWFEHVDAFHFQLTMGSAITFSCRSILAAALAEIGGSEPVLVTVSANDSFRMHISLDVPSSVDVGLMHNIAVTGNAVVTEDAAAESAYVCAMRVMWQDYSYSVVDYSFFRMWGCKERYSGLLEKLHESKSVLLSGLVQPSFFIN
jgi:hypothetical protein